MPRENHEAADVLLPRGDRAARGRADRLQEIGPGVERAQHTDEIDEAHQGVVGDGANEGGVVRDESHVDIRSTDSVAVEGINPVHPASLVEVQLLLAGAEEAEDPEPDHELEASSHQRRDGDDDAGFRHDVAGVFVLLVIALHGEARLEVDMIAERGGVPHHLLQQLEGEVDIPHLAYQHLPLACGPPGKMQRIKLSDQIACLAPLGTL
mmetsp:Transcript_158534/g.508626  ORF Transcript_158534/g.508626 Transcript_158534/m.508626 type:complete len:209 (+) Transcript_158534:613-1239(+)